MNLNLIYLITLFLFCLCSCEAPSSKDAPSATPNVIVIITDDQGWGDIGYNNPAVYTPNLDKLAASGALFNQHYTMPQCTPTRVALFTGKYPGRFGTNARQANNDPVFPLGTFTMAQMFKQAGYQTYLCGKWHMGSNTDFGPNHFGFDESFGSMAGAVGMYDHRYREGVFEFAWHRNHDTIPGHENGIHATDLTAGDAIRVIRQAHEKPYFIYLAFNAPHTPLDERGEFVDTPTQLDPKNPDRWLNEDKIKWFNDPAGKIQQEPDPEKRLLLAAVHHVDDAIGQVIKALDESGQRENTLILFSSDNGPQVNWGGNAYPDDLRLTDFNQPIPMRGSKLDVWEGGIHVPGFANWQGQISPKSIETPVHIVDWLPTLLDLTNQKVPDSVALDGSNIMPLLLETDTIQSRDLYWIWNKKTNRWALRDGDWKIVKYGNSAPESPEDWMLVNLVRDPLEEQNLGDSFPEIRAQLHQQYLIHRAKDQEIEF